MLKTMRRNVKTLKPILWIIIATFVIAIFAIWGLGGGGISGSAASSLVKVGGRSITRVQYEAALRQTIQGMQRQVKELNRGLIEQLNLPQQTLERLVQQTLLLQLAREMGLKATNAELRDEILRLPYFQRDGQFAGYADYRRVLEMNRIKVDDFERDLKTSLVVNKVVQVLTAGVSVADQEVWDAWKKTKDSAKMEYVVAETAKMPEPPAPDAARVQSWYDAHKAGYKIPERREAVYVLFRIEDLKKEVQVNDRDIESYYKDNKTQFTDPERVRVSRIWLPFTAAEKDATMAKARDLALRAQAGADFADLARTNSKDEKAASGGDYGTDEWRALASEETAAVGKLEAGKTSDPVEEANGVAILKVVEKTPETVRTLAEVRAQVKTILEDQKARELATQRATALAASAKRDKSLDTAAQKMGVKFAATGLVKRGDAVGDADTSGAVSDALFGLKEKEISGPVQTYGGAAVAELRTISPEHAATLDEVRSQVVQDVQAADRKESAKAKLEALLPKLGDKWEEAAKAAGLEYKAVEDHKREQYLSPFGESKDVDQAAFTLPVKEASRPIAVDTGFVVLRVLSRTEGTKEEFDKVKETERTTLLEGKRNQVLSSWLAQARERRKIEVNYQAYLDANKEILGRFGE